MSELTQEEVLKIGIRAGELLNNEDLMHFVAEEKEDLLTCIANTAPHEVKTRESLYLQHHAINALVSRLQQYVASAQAVANVNAAEQNEQETD